MKGTIINMLLLKALCWFHRMINEGQKVSVKNKQRALKAINILQIANELSKFHTCYETCTVFLFFSIFFFSMNNLPAVLFLFLLFHNDIKELQSRLFIKYYCRCTMEVPGCFKATDKSLFKVSTWFCSVLEESFSNSFSDFENASKASLYFLSAERQTPTRYCPCSIK